MSRKTARTVGLEPAQAKAPRSVRRPPKITLLVCVDPRLGEESELHLSRRFLALAGSAEDFPYPPEPPAVDPGPKAKLGECSRKAGLAGLVGGWRGSEELVRLLARSRRTRARRVPRRDR